MPPPHTSPHYPRVAIMLDSGAFAFAPVKWARGNTMRARLVGRYSPPCSKRTCVKTSRRIGDMSASLHHAYAFLWLSYQDATTGLYGRLIAIVPILHRRAPPCHGVAGHILSALPVRLTIPPPSTLYRWPVMHGRAVTVTVFPVYARKLRET